MRTNRRVVSLLIAGAMLALPWLPSGQSAEAAPETTAVNAEGQTYDSHPSMVVLDDGAAWIAWDAYYRDAEQILVRRIDASGKAGPVHVVSARGEVHGSPSLVRGDSRSVWVVWNAIVDRSWCVLAKRLTAGDSGLIHIVSAPGTDAVFPTAVSVADGKVMLAWSAWNGDRFQVSSRVCEDETWQKPQVISSASRDAFRPALAADDRGTVWAFWDQLEDGKYAVCGRRLLPEKQPIERVSARGQHCLQPAAMLSRQGICVAWLHKTDVIGGPGVVSQWHTLEMATRRNDEWVLVTSLDGNATAAELTQGLMAQIDPKPVATGGYLGRRTQAMLLEDGTDVWILWERKADHRGHTPFVFGQLAGRPMRNGVWGPPVQLHEGKVDYHLADPPRSDKGRFALIASDLPRRNRRVYHRMIGDLNQTRNLEQSVWTGWNPIDLPIESELTERRDVQLSERTYHLYWADLHCHSGLTADAEGEPDELTQYARDRAKLDVVVFTENDFIYDVPMTRYEYELGNFFAAVYTQPGHFLSLPGYEWTSRIPGVPGAGIADPGNWTPPYQNRSFPNHRSVIFPSAAPALRYPEIGNEIGRLNQAVKDAGGVTLTQHPAFRVTGHEVEVGMEVTSGWGTYVTGRPDSFFTPLNDGARLAFVGNGDSHRRAPGLSGGLTGIFAEQLTPEAILDALRNRRCYATNGSRIFIDARANGAFMGEVADAEEHAVNLRLRAIGTRPIVSAHLIRDGAELKEFSGSGKRELTIDYRDTDLSQGTHWYYWRVAQRRSAPDLPGNLMVAHGHLAWSSPVWVVAE